MSRSKQYLVIYAALVLSASLALGAVGYIGWFRPAAAGGYERLAASLNASPRAEACDRAGAERKVRLGRLLDHFHGRIRELWHARQAKDFRAQKMEAVGPVFFRLAAPTAPAPAGFDVNAFSWEEAQGTLARTQINPQAPDTKERWRDLDTMLLYLFQKDAGRLLAGRPYLAPALTPHTFRPHAGVRRDGPRDFSVELNAGDFHGAEEKLARLLEGAWSTAGYRLHVRFGNAPGLYRVRANFRSSRSFVDHQARALVIANYAFKPTVAHELGHVLGFDDHYYNVWHGDHCYYTQEARVADLMSSSERGQVSLAHWRLMEKAYPARAVGGPQPFTYVFAADEAAPARQ